MTFSRRIDDAHIEKPRTAVLPEPVDLNEIHASLEGQIEKAPVLPIAHFDNVTTLKIGNRDVYPFANQMHRQWRWAPALPHESKQNRVELAFADMDFDVVPTNDGQTFFTLGTKRRTRRMQGTFSAGTSLETWVATAKRSN